MLYAVVDTNVVVASLLTRRHDSPTVRITTDTLSPSTIAMLKFCPFASSNKCNKDECLQIMKPAQNHKKCS